MYLILFIDESLGLDDVLRSASVHANANIILHYFANAENGDYTISTQCFGGDSCKVTYNIFKRLNGQVDALLEQDHEFDVLESEHLSNIEESLDYASKTLEDSFIQATIPWEKSCIEQWRQELQTSFHWVNRAKDNVVIGVVGNSKVGKSTMINTLLGVNLLPTLEGTICTSVGTRISYMDSDIYTAEIELISPAELLSSLDLYISLLEEIETYEKEIKDEYKSDEAREALKISLSSVKDKIEASHTRLSLIFGEEHLKKLRKGHNSDKKWKEAIRILEKPPICIQENTPKSMEDKIISYIDSETCSQFDGNIPLAPLVSEVKISGRFDILKTGTSIIDLPGITDSNVVRRNVALEKISSCHYIWHLVDIHNARDNSQTLLWEEITKSAPHLLDTLLIIPTKFALDIKSAAETYRKEVNKKPKGGFSVLMHRYQRCIALYSSELRMQSHKISEEHSIANSPILPIDSKEWSCNKMVCISLS